MINKEPEAGLEKEIREEVAGNMTSIEATNHLIEVVRQQIDKAREEARDKYLSKDGAAYDAGLLRGKEVILSRIEEEVDNKERITLDKEDGTEVWFDKGYNTALTDIKAIISKVREENEKAKT